MRRTLIIAACAVLLAGCRDEGGITDPEFGTVTGYAFVDRDGDSMFDADEDGIAAGVSASLLLDATGDTVARATARADGTFTMPRIPVGVYRLVASRGVLGDTVEVQRVEAARFSVIARDTVHTTITLGFPAVTVADVRAGMPAGRRVTLRGIALNGRTTFGDSTVHVRDHTGALITARVSGTVSAGDSVRIVGTTSTRNGQPIVTDASAALIRASVGAGTPDSLGTAAAATASGGARDADQVRVAAQIVGSLTLPSGELQITVDDGSGPLSVLFDRDVTFTAGPYVPGALITVSGVLVPSGAGAWTLKPRTADEAVATYPTVSIAEARALAPGRTVYVRARALNSWVTFGDSTVHLADGTLAIRVTRLPPTAIFAGDSVRVLATTAVRNGQPVLTGVSSAILLSGVGLPPIDSVTTAVAAAAAAGARDAHHVAVSGEITAVTQATPQSEVRLTITDTSGPLTVVLSPAVGFATGPFVVGARTRARGVLVPAASGTAWELKPRTVSEAVVTAPPPAP
jgi:hypothetical protein